MHSADAVRRAFSLAGAGLSQAEIADALAIGQTTVGRWLRAGLDQTLDRQRLTTSERCPADCPVVDRAPPQAYAYLLGQYLGDGSISDGARGVQRLTVTCCAAYPNIAAETSAAMLAVLPVSSVGARNKPGAIDLSCYSKHMSCVFPQHGRGRKHERSITLTPWQEAIALRGHPQHLIRGLIHSDGCRSINRVTSRTGKRYEYVRYLFSNRSADIRSIFCNACDALEIEWRQMNAHNISVARRGSVARLEAIVGQKR